MARGVPAVCSTGSALNETVGDAALQVPATDIGGWAEALRRLQDDDDLRATLVERGLARVGQFSPAANARAHVELFHALLR